MGNYNFLVFPGGASGEDSACQCKRRKRCGFSPWVKKIPREGNGNPLQYSCLEDYMDRGGWWDPVQRVAKQLSTQHPDLHGQKQTVQIYQTGNSNMHNQTERAWLRKERSLENVIVNWNAKPRILEYIVSKKTACSKQK